MENCIILSKFIIILSSIIIYIQRYAYSDEKTMIVVFIILVYMILDILAYLFKKKRIKSFIKITVVVLLTMAYCLVNPVFILLVPINIYELINYKVKWYIIALCNLFLIFLIKSEIIISFIIVDGFSYLIYELCNNAYSRIEKLVIENDELKEKNLMLASSLSYGRDYEDKLRYTTQIEERNKIAQEIHDKLGHSISGGVMQLEAAKIVMEKDTEGAEKLIQNTIDVLREGMENIRSTLRNIKPSPEHIGINKIKLLVSEFGRASGIDAQLIYIGDLDKINYIQWNVISDNIKEALTNTSKYAGASKVKVTIELLNKAIKVEIKDNGVGNYKIKKGLGINGMEERSASVGGKVIVDGSNGFSVIMLLPISTEA